MRCTPGKWDWFSTSCPITWAWLARRTRWWWDVLAKGEKSEFAKHFDIDWQPAEKNLRGKVLVPILGAEFETVLNRGELKLLREDQRFVLGYHEHRLPIAPESNNQLPADDKALERFNVNYTELQKLIRQQYYHLAFYEPGDTQINYRRFFAVSTLAAVRVENEETFAATHGLLRRWLEAGVVDGVRVDHPDGLRDPAKYLERLRGLAPKAWIVVEKILEAGERMPANWPVQGTTGYDFLNQVNGLFVDTGAEAAFTELYHSFTSQESRYAPMLLEKKRAVLKTLLVAELNRLTGLLVAAASEDAVKEFSVPNFKECLVEVIACFPVYRSYLTDGDDVDPADIAAIKTAVHLACENRKDLPEPIFAFIHALLLKPKRGAAALNFVARFQQLTGAVMAKGAEDTAFYCYNRFVSLNEVGGNPGQFGVRPQAFHHFIQRQKKDWPHTQLATSTHDTKRAEDVRARLNVLSEIPVAWAQAVRRWSEMNARHRTGDFPDRNAEYLYYQTLAGAWPLPEDRALTYFDKASHEAKEHTDWTRRNAEYEAALKKFISDTLHDSGFIKDLEDFVRPIAGAAAVNSLAQTLIKLTAPGVPDIYQGGELWDLSLVDPDNRRPVNFGQCEYFLEATGLLSPETVWKQRDEGLPKLWLIHKVLHARGQIEKFEDLDYEPVQAQGVKSENVVAFSRGDRLITVVPRLNLQVHGDWQDTTVTLPPGRWCDACSGQNFSDTVRMADLFQKFPVALLVRKETE